MLQKTQFDTVINVPPTIIGNSQSIGPSTQLNVFDGGSVGSSFEASGSPKDVTEVNIFGGNVSFGYEAKANSVTNVFNGVIKKGPIAFRDSVVNIHGGDLGGSFEARNGSTVNLSGGIVGNVFDANGSAVNISGGSIGDSLNARNGSVITMSGGSIGDGGCATASCVFNVSGGYIGSDFGTFGAQMDFTGGRLGHRFLIFCPGVTFFGGEFVFNKDNVLYGTLEDGSVILVSASKAITDVVETVVPELDLEPIVVDSLLDKVPNGVRPGQLLELSGNGTLFDEFRVAGGTLDIAGGEVGDHLHTVDSVVTISNGMVGAHFVAWSGTTLNLSGGQIGRFFRARKNSTVNITGGVLDRTATACDGSCWNISAGSIGANSSSIVLTCEEGSKVAITGGTFGRLRFIGDAHIAGGIFNFSVDVDAGNGLTILSGGQFNDRFTVDSGGQTEISGGIYDHFRAQNNSNVNVSGVEFKIDGETVNGLLLNNPFEVSDRDVTLTGKYPNGDPFEFELNSQSVTGNDYFHTGANLSVTLVASEILGDLNGDAEVSLLDIMPFVSLLAMGDYAPLADINQDNEVDLLDVEPFVAILVGP